MRTVFLKEMDLEMILMIAGFQQLFSTMILFIKRKRKKIKKIPLFVLQTIISQMILQNFCRTGSNHKEFKPFHATDLFWYPLKTSENLWFSDVFRGYQKRPASGNGLISFALQDMKLKQLLKTNFNVLAMQTKEEWPYWTKIRSISFSIFEQNETIPL